MHSWHNDGVTWWCCPQVLDAFAFLHSWFGCQSWPGPGQVAPPRFPYINARLPFSFTMHLQHLECQHRSCSLWIVLDQRSLPRTGWGAAEQFQSSFTTTQLVRVPLLTSISASEGIHPPPQWCCTLYCAVSEESSSKDTKHCWGSTWNTHFCAAVCTWWALIYYCSDQQPCTSGESVQSCSCWGLPSAQMAITWWRGTQHTRFFCTRFVAVRGQDKQEKKRAGWHSCQYFGLSLHYCL